MLADGGSSMFVKCVGRSLERLDVHADFLLMCGSSSGAREEFKRL